MARFVWEDGTLVSKAKVDINGTVYEVDPEEYSGTTPLSANNLNAMQDDIYMEIDKQKEILGVNVNNYSNTKKYGIGDVVVYDNRLYKCITPVTSGESFDPAKWETISIINDGNINNELMKTTFVNETGTDLNNYINDGTYFFDSEHTPLNIPDGSNGWLQVTTGLDIFTHGGTLTRDWVKQIWHRAGSTGRNDYETYVRTKSTAGTWSEWKKYIVGYEYSDDLTTYTITIPHNSPNNMKSAFVYCAYWAGVVTIGGSSDVLSFTTGGTSGVTMTPSIEEHTPEYVKVKLTFNQTIWGGIKAII